MISRLLKFGREEVIKGSLILLVTINLFSILNFIFNISMARMLSLADYGILTTLISLILIFAVFSESIQTVISRYSTKEKDLGKLKDIMKKGIKKASRISLLLYIIFLIAAIPLSYLLKIDYYLIGITGLMIILTFILSITRGIMQGKKKFAPLGMNMISEGVIKLVLAVFLVFLGIGIFGAMLGIITGGIGALFLSFISLRNILSSKRKPSKTPDIYSYTKPVFINMLAIMLFLSLDIVLAKLFFSPDTVGAYAIASTIAKIIFIGTQPISKAMFPITTEVKNKKKSKNIFLNALFLVGVIVLIAVLITAFFPRIIVRLYSGREIYSSISILFYLAVAMGLLSLSNLMLFYRLSIGKTKTFWILLIFVAIEIILLSIFHKNLVEFSIALIVASASFLLGSILLLRK